MENSENIPDVARGRSGSDVGDPREPHTGASLPRMSALATTRPTSVEALAVFGAGFAASALGMAVAPRVVSNSMSWGPGSGWMREIVIWNVGTLVGLRGAMKPDADPHRALIAGYTVTSALFALNHVVSAVESPKKVGHWGTGLMNIGAVALGIGALQRR